MLLDDDTITTTTTAAAAAAITTTTTTTAEIRILCLQLKPDGFPRIKVIDMNKAQKRK
jgi:hypothetical protein